MAVYFYRTPQNSAKPRLYRGFALYLCISVIFVLRKLFGYVIPNQVEKTTAKQTVTRSYAVGKPR